MSHVPLRGPPNETWADVKQLAWALLLVCPFIALAAWGARVLIGARAALWLGIGLAAFAFVTFAVIVALSLTVSYGHEFGGRLIAALRRRRARDGDARDRGAG